MDPKRQGEIALVLVKALAHREGPEKMLRHVGKLSEVAKATRIEIVELKTFFEILLKNLVTEWFK